jgi:hypothetical protein
MNREMRQCCHGRWGTHIVKANPQLAEDIVAAPSRNLGRVPPDR